MDGLLGRPVEGRVRLHHPLGDGVPERVDEAREVHGLFLSCVWGRRGVRGTVAGLRSCKEGGLVGACLRMFQSVSSSKASSCSSAAVLGWKGTMPLSRLVPAAAFARSLLAFLTMLAC